jgi:hypothetical protein
MMMMMIACCKYMPFKFEFPCFSFHLLLVLSEGPNRGLPSDDVSGDYRQPINVLVELAFTGQG